MKKGNKKKKIILIVSIVAGVLLVLWLLWFFWLEKVYIFHEQEKQLLDAAERYFELNSQRLPDEENDVTTVELQTLYKEKWITSLYVPKSDQLCDTASWVKVRKEDGENVYYTYLKFCLLYLLKIQVLNLLLYKTLHLSSFLIHSHISPTFIIPHYFKLTYKK